MDLIYTSILVSYFIGTIVIFTFHYNWVVLSGFVIIVFLYYAKAKINLHNAVKFFHFVFSIFIFISININE